MKKLLVLGCVFLACSLVANAQDYPKAEVFGGYSYLHSSVLGNGINFNGGSGSVAFNPHPNFGLVADVGAYHNTSSFGVDTTSVSFLFGPKFAYRGKERVTPYAQVLFGGVHDSSSLGTVSASDTAFAFAIGGGVDAKVSPHVAIRVAQIDYLLTKFRDFDNDRQNNVRISAGIVFRWGGK